jgi:hypothetical protein
MRLVLKSSAVLLFGFLHVLGAVSPASAQVPVPLTVTGNQARGVIELPGGIGAELTISFEAVVGLHPDALQVSATLVDPNDRDLLARLPGIQESSVTGLLGQVITTLSYRVTIPPTFPVVLRIDPSPLSGLSFSGVVTVSLYTHNLNLNPAVPMALYKAHAGGSFFDITAIEGRGSYRAGGGGGDFSEFLIVIDTRPIDEVIGGKFGALQSLLNDHAGSMPENVASHLQERVNSAQALYQAGVTVAAIGQMKAFSNYVAARSGKDIPDVWRANDPSRVNVAGLLRSAADTLRFSLDRKASR